MMDGGFDCPLISSRQLDLRGGALARGQMDPDLAVRLAGKLVNQSKDLDP